jgi:hypothetical protein
VSSIPLSPRRLNPVERFGTTIALGAVEKALAEFKTTGTMTKTAKGALSRDVALKLIRSQETDECARKYNVVR